MPHSGPGDAARAAADQCNAVEIWCVHRELTARAARGRVVTPACVVTPKRETACTARGPAPGQRLGGRRGGWVEARRRRGGEGGERGRGVRGRRRRARPRLSQAPGPRRCVGGGRVLPKIPAPRPNRPPPPRAPARTRLCMHTSRRGCGSWHICPITTFLLAEVAHLQLNNLVSTDCSSCLWYIWNSNHILEAHACFLVSLCLLFASVGQASARPIASLP